MYPETYSYNYSNLKKLSSEELREMLYSTTFHNQYRQMIVAELVRRHKDIQTLTNILFELEQADMPVLGVQI